MTIPSAGSTKPSGLPRTTIETLLNFLLCPLPLCPLSLCLQVAFISFQIAFFAAFSLCSTPHVFAQTADSSTEEVVRVETNLVAVPVFVTDAHGRRVPGLSADAFTLRADGRSVPVAYFNAGTERVALTFLLDASGSTRETITRQRETAATLLARFGATSRVAVWRFWERPELVVPFTTEREPVREAFQLPILPDRHTAIFDAALAAVRLYGADTGAQTERRIVILISDGLDTASTTRAATVVEEARASGVSFYVIHLPLFAPREGRLAPRPTAKGFRDLAAQTGGQFFTLGDAATALDPHARPDLTPIFQAIAEDLQGQYVLGFYAPDANAANAAPDATGATGDANAAKASNATAPGQHTTATNNNATNNAPAPDRRAHTVEVGLSATTNRKLRVRALRRTYQLQTRATNDNQHETR